MVETAEVQGNVLYAYGDRFPCARYVLLRITQPSAAREILRGWLPEVTFGSRPWDGPGDPRQQAEVSGGPAPAAKDRPHVNVAFTFRGLQALGAPDDVLYAFPDDFRQGALDRAAENGDVGSSSPDCVDGWAGNGRCPPRGSRRVRQRSR